jgi:hypothetical protein
LKVHQAGETPSSFTGPHQLVIKVGQYVHGPLQCTGDQSLDAHEPGVGTATHMLYPTRVLSTILLMYTLFTVAMCL